MNQPSQLPCLSRVEFFRLKEDELISAVAEAIATHAKQFPDGELTSSQVAVYAWARMAANVLNGGFTQFFYNHGGDLGVAELADLFDSIDLPKAGTLLRDASTVYHRYQAAFDVENPWDGLFGSIKEFDKLDRAFGNILLRGNRGLEKWLRLHITELANDELAKTIDPAFTGCR